MFEIQHASPRVGSIIRTTKQDMVKGTYAAEINRLLTERSALVFPQVHLTIEEQLAFASTIGEIFLVGGKEVQKISMDPEINPVADYIRGAFYWHIDGANDRHKWSVGDFLLFDNTGTMHQAAPYDLKSNRLFDPQ
jgi:alpha-ketoglutarate-dependent taurine dioxygenase